jgi:DNA-binding NtrC family response regulator
VPPNDETLSNPASGSLKPAARPRPFLLVVMEMEQPLARPGLYGLDALDEVLLGRGATRVWSRQSHEGRRQLVLQLRDRWMSREHARLVRAGEQWMLEDVNSKNGLRVNGTALGRGWLADGDLIELGHTLLLFRLTAGTGPAFSLDASGGEPQEPVPGFATMNPGLTQELAKLARVASTPVPVVVEGETGTGKELLARAYHALSGRPGEFVAVNCGALPDTLVQSELFGYRKGAFSGATEDRPGLVRSSDRGTLFLDEIGELPLPAQASLLRVLQESEVLPVGGTRPLAVDLRVVAATNRDLAAAVREGRFREDFYYRLNVFSIEVPPLRERKEDLVPLAHAVLARKGLPASKLSKEAETRLTGYTWPGNVRELENALERSLILSGEGDIQAEHLGAGGPSLSRGGGKGVRAADVLGEGFNLDAFERELLYAALERAGGNKTAAAKLLGITRRRLYSRLQSLGEKVTDPDSD